MLCYDVICIDENCVVRVSFMIGLRESAQRGQSSSVDNTYNGPYL